VYKRASPADFTRHRLAWFTVGVLTLAVPFLWPAGIYILWKLFATRGQSGVAAPSERTEEVVVNSGYAS
jgi:hypothetical protein